MTITLLDTNFKVLSVVDEYESFIWTDRYKEPGDFEYYNLVNKENFELFKPGYYLANDESDHLMIIEKVEIITNVEEGSHIKVSGRSLESILDRRIVWNQTVLSGNLQNGILSIINSAFINPAIADRKIDNFQFVSSEDERVTVLTIDAQYTGDNILKIVTDICEDAKMGYKIVLDGTNFVMSFYFGTDRSDEVNDPNVIIFSYDFDNVLNMDYTEDNSTYKSITLIAGEGEGNTRKTATYGSGSGLNRKELFTDARDISSKADSGTIPAAQYTSLLEQRGKEKLAENVVKKDYDGEVDTTGMYKYGVDFFLGDEVLFKDLFGNSTKVRIDEIIFSNDSNGYTRYPTFTIVEEEENK